MLLSNIKNIDEITDKLLAIMSSEQMDHLKQLRKEDLIIEHYGFSLWVRNQLNNMPFQPNKVEEYQPTHLDEISSKITEMLWHKLQLNSIEC
jgi:hypothetical protein